MSPLPFLAPCVRTLTGGGWNAEVPSSTAGAQLAAHVVAASRATAAAAAFAAATTRLPPRAWVRVMVGLGSAAVARRYSRAREVNCRQVESKRDRRANLQVVCVLAELPVGDEPLEALDLIALVREERTDE